ncbi:amino acid ABC transporter permease [Acrocarpospora catenulata]|uniref:amino acid ABC transporter permease n=1 Tax=Acrocarpospora catenulata TaxID=2836182 RepID=UPI001BD98481|nr:amino acid ABC transporter permease [Acrocarpospora catenulata]
MTLTAPSIDAAEDVAQAKPRIRVWRWVTGTVFTLFAIQFAHFLVTNERFEWPVVWEYLFDKSIMEGIRTTLTLWLVVIVLGTVAGVCVALAKLSSYAPSRWLATAYVSVFVAIPPLVQLIFWFNLAYLQPEISIRIPFGPVFHSWPTNVVISTWTAAVLALAIVESAYMSEIIRGGILGVDAGQTEASKAVGFGSGVTFFKIIVPQALRIILPAWGTRLVTVLKATSLVSIVALTDLLRSVQEIYNVTYQTIPLLLVACFWYLVMVTVLTTVRNQLERRFSRGHDVGGPARTGRVRTARRQANRVAVDG